MKIKIIDEQNEYNEEFNSKYIILSSDKYVYIGGNATPDNIIDSVVKILLSSHKALKSVYDDDYTFNKFIEDVKDECYYIKEKIEESDKKINSINRSITIDEEELYNQIINDLGKKFGFNFDDTEGDKNDSTK